MRPTTGPRRPARQPRIDLPELPDDRLPIRANLPTDPVWPGRRL